MTTSDLTRGDEGYAAGTRLAAERGSVAVETLQAGERLLTLSGEYKPIVRIHRRRIGCGGRPASEQVWPVVIAAGAFGEGSPERDLVVSPDLALFVDGGLAPAIRLVNGATIRQAPVADVDYWQIELAAHEVIYAEGLPAESCLGLGGDETCFRHVDDAGLVALRESLLRRTADFGFAFEDEPDLHALADGRRIEPLRLSENRFAFAFPAGVAQALLVSRVWRPSEATPDNRDPRTLGVCLSRLDVDGSTLDLSDERLSEGWSWYETAGRQRWTTGRASLPAGLRIALLDICGRGLYLRRPRPFALEA